MWDISPDHAAGLYAGLIALPLALLALRLRPARRVLPGTAQAAAVLMAVCGAIHLGLVPSHLGEPITAALFVFNGLAYIGLSLAFTWRYWRLAAFSLLTATILGYLGFISFGFDSPDQVAVSTKLVELTALGLLLVPVRGFRAPADRVPYWALIAAGLPLLTLLTGTTVWAIDLSRPDPQHAHAGAVLQPTNDVATPGQRAAATQLYEETLVAIQPYEDWHRAWAAGYRPGGSQSLPSTHWMNQDFVKSGYVLDPRHPQGLVYANTPHGPVLLGAMFQMRNIGQFGPDPGGPLTAWHEHENICVTPFGFEFSLMTPYATCPLGAIDITVTAMLHVWIVDNPTGQFAVDIDPSVVARIDRA